MKKEKISSQKKHQFYIICILLIIFLSIFIFGYSFHLILQQKEIVENDEKREIESNLKISEDLYMTLFHKISNAFSHGANPYGYYYTSDFLRVEEMTDEAKAVIGLYGLIQNQTVKKNTISFTRDEVIESIRGILGPTVIYNDVQNISVEFMQFKYENGQYIGVKKEVNAPTSEILTNTIQSTKENNEITITVKMAYVLPDTQLEHPSYLLYNQISIPYIDGISPISNIYVPSFDTKNIDIRPYYDELYTYKFTFTLHRDGNYYFASVKRMK